MRDQKTYCEISYPGSFYPEEQVIEVEARQPEEIAKKYPCSFAFQFFDQVKQEVEVDGVKRIVSGDRKNLSPKYFPGGELFTKTQVDALGPIIEAFNSHAALAEENAQLRKALQELHDNSISLGEDYLKLWEREPDSLTVQGWHLGQWRKLHVAYAQAKAALEQK